MWIQIAEQTNILAHSNDNFGDVNTKNFAKIPGVAREYKPLDEMMTDKVVNYPTECLNSLEISGLPQHKLKLTIVAPIICLRNMNPQLLCNGTRLVVKLL
jgi:hypothetical protein